MSNYVVYHLHSDDSLLDSCTKFEAYVDRARELGQTAIASTEHGRPIDWVRKQQYCDKMGIKFIFGVEAYLTATLDEKVRDNYHTVLLAKNELGRKEIQRAISRSTDDAHFYFKNRLTFDEFLALSDNVIKISACLASPLNKYDKDESVYEKLARHYDYYELQAHNNADQIAYNQRLLFLSQKYHKPLIAGTDTHSLDAYKAECRRIMLLSKKIEFAQEDEFDLTYKSYDELCDMFRAQDAVPEAAWMEAIENTNRMADSVEPFVLDTSIKYPILYGSPEKDNEVFHETIDTMLEEKLRTRVIPQNQADAFRANLEEEKRVFTKIGMGGFMQAMGELIRWCKSEGMPVGPGRGSVCGSSAAYVTDITDVNPVQWHTVFSRFANEDRVEVGDIDVDVVDSDRPRIFQYITERFGQAYTARVPAYGTTADKSAVDDIGRALATIWKREHPDAKDKENPYSLQAVAQIKKEYVANADKARKKYPELFRYYDGIVGTKVSQSVHPAGIVISPVTLEDNYGVFWKDGELVLNIDMDEIHDCGLVKFDFLVLRNVAILNDTCKLAGIPYPKAHEVDWNDSAVWADMMRSPVGIFQFEGEYAFRSLKQFGAKSIFDMSLVTAAIRPSGASYRNDLMAHKIHKNPSPIIDDLLRDNLCYLVYQEDVLKFLQTICGFTGSEADTVRRGIARKKAEVLDGAMPKILDGYCANSDRPREVAEAEAREFVQIIEDASSYMFGYNHSIAYCLIGYLCAYLRYYHPLEFITALLNNAANEDDISGGTNLARLYGFKILPPRWGMARAHYVPDEENGAIIKGISSIKTLNDTVPDELYNLAHMQELHHFADVLLACRAQTSLRADQRDALIDVDFFDKFGSVLKLRRVAEAVEFFKYGEAKTVSKAKAGEYENFIRPYASDRTKNGKESKNYAIIDVQAILRAYEDSLGDEEISLADKARAQKERLGYVDLVTGNADDRRRVLAVTKPMALSSTYGNGAVWCYRCDLRSIGTGKVVRVSVRPKCFQEKPFGENDCLEVAPYGMTQDKKGYWWLVDYEKF